LNSIRIMPGIVPVTGRTHEEAQEKFDALQAF
jgi:alkanesulfonate monooxygenase SsuD/methylene tetrahydromethanopterin reductase-like flavin-dependent oxidoreductase (luciferase family)